MLAKFLYNHPVLIFKAMLLVHLIVNFHACSFFFFFTLIFLAIIKFLWILFFDVKTSFRHSIANVKLFISKVFLKNSTLISVWNKTIINTTVNNVLINQRVMCQLKCFHFKSNTTKHHTWERISFLWYRKQIWRGTTRH